LSNSLEFFRLKVIMWKNLSRQTNESFSVKDLISHDLYVHFKNSFSHKLKLQGTRTKFQQLSLNTWAQEIWPISWGVMPQDRRPLNPWLKMHILIKSFKRLVKISAYKSIVCMCLRSNYECSSQKYTCTLLHLQKSTNSP
jgi:hypothetical protein